jgi:hypothetical protein
MAVATPIGDCTMPEHGCGKRPNLYRSKFFSKTYAAERYMSRCTAQKSVLSFAAGESQATLRITAELNAESRIEMACVGKRKTRSIRRPLRAMATSIENLNNQNDVIAPHLP